MVEPLLFQTYYGVRVSSITDPVRQKALKTMIETYGQTPRQLFNYPHSPRLTRKTSTSPAEFGSMTSLNTSKFDFEVASATNLFMNRFAGSFSSENTLSGSVTDTLVGKISMCFWKVQFNYNIKTED